VKREAGAFLASRIIVNALTESPIGNGKSASVYRSAWTRISSAAISPIEDFRPGPFLNLPAPGLEQAGANAAAGPSTPLRFAQDENYIINNYK
jgi:hypothetical protein